MAKYENTNGITSYELLIVKDHTVLRFNSDDARFVKGYSAIESLPTSSPKQSTLELLRKQGREQAANFDVLFIDRTTR